jgi:pimeloyl-ACP methyl ester carboxylesterase
VDQHSRRPARSTSRAPRYSLASTPQVGGTLPEKSGKHAGALRNIFAAAPLIFSATTDGTIAPTRRKWRGTPAWRVDVSQRPPQDCPQLKASEWIVTKVPLGDGSAWLNTRSWGQWPPQALLIHGFGDSSFVWHAVACHIEARVPIVGLDLRGHGDSTWHAEHDYCAETHASDVTSIIQRLELSDLTLIGHSLGAIVALRVASGASSLVRRLVLVDGGPELSIEALDYIYDLFSSQPFRYERIQDYADVLALRTHLTKRSTLEAFARETLQPDGLGGFILKCDPAMRHTSRSSSPELWSLLSSLHCPVLIARGRASAVLSQQAASRMLNALQRGELVSIPAAGHAVMLDNPAVLASEILSFLTR